MVMINAEIMAEFRFLIEICEDAQKGYRLAAKREEDLELKELFNRFSDEKESFASDLREKLSGLEQSLSGGIIGLASEPGIQLFTKAVATGDTSEAIIAECKNEEETAQQIYEETLKRKDLPAHLQNMLKSQYMKIREARDTFARLSGNLNSADEIGSATDGAPD